MPHLDSVLHSPDRTGPSRNYAALAAVEPQFRQESFQIAPARRAISMNANMQPRPNARDGTGYRQGLIPHAPTPVLVRNSNQRPMESGEGNTAEVWNVSAPTNAGGMLPGMGVQGVSGLGALATNSLAVGVAVGLAAFFLLRKKR